MSGYAILAKDWGADVSGWDRVETPYLEHVRAAGIPVIVEPEPPAPPDGVEVFVSTAFAGRVAGRPRADLLAELVGLQDAIVVAGAHGKTTTAAMVAFVLDRLGCDPSFLLGGEVEQLGGNARAGSGWLVAEGDESDRTVAALPAKIAVITNLDLDHHATFASEAELEALLHDWIRTQSIPVVIDGSAVEPVGFELALPGEHNRINAACALAALEAAGLERAEAEAVLPEFRGVHRRFELRGETDGIRVYDDYAHHPSELAATLAAARPLAGDGRVLVLFQPHLYSRTLHLAHELGATLAAADFVCVTDVYAAREEPLESVTGKLVVDRLSEARPGMSIGWTPSVDDGAALLRSVMRPGDVVLTIGAGDVDRAVPLLLEDPTS